MVQVSLTPQECAVLMSLLEKCMERDNEHPLRRQCEELYENFVKQLAEELDHGTPP